MKLEKKHWIMLIAGVVVLYLVYWFFFRNSKKSESSYDPYLPIFGGGMLENNYSASMLDPKGIESGYVRGAIKGGPQQAGAAKCVCDQTKTGLCYKKPGSVPQCGASLLPTSGPEDAGGRMMASAGGIGAKGVAGYAENCRAKGGTWAEYWSDTANAWVWGCLQVSN